MTLGGNKAAEPLRVAVVGYGNIGRGLVRHLLDHKELLKARTPAGIELRWVCDRSIERKKDLHLPHAVRATREVRDVLDDEEVQAVVEVVGGVEGATQIVTEAFASGKHVVTANKAMLSHCGPELAEMARQNGLRLLFEASVCAGVPVIQSIEHGLAADRITAIHGIMNGTTNFILSQMESTGSTFEEALAEATRLGYAERDPSLDVDGHDPAHKLAILASLAFGLDVRAGDVRTRGIRELRPCDIRWAAGHGLRIRLLASAVRDIGERLTVAVRPVLVPSTHPIGNVIGVNNGVWIEADPIGPTFYFGAGAGAGSTASGILSDLITLARDPEPRNLAGPHTFAEVLGKKDGLAGGNWSERRAYLRFTGPEALAVGKKLVSEGVARPLFAQGEDAAVLLLHPETTTEMALGKKAPDDASLACTRLELALGAAEALTQE